MPNYYAVIPANVLYADISSTSKIFYAVISSLTSTKGYCWARNEYLAKILNLDKRQIKRLIRELSDAGFIEIELINGYLRKIYLATAINDLGAIDVPEPYNPDTLGPICPTPRTSSSRLHYINKEDSVRSAKKPIVTTPNMRTYDEDSPNFYNEEPSIDYFTGERSKTLPAGPAGTFIALYYELIRQRLKQKPLINELICKKKYNQLIHKERFSDEWLRFLLKKYIESNKQFYIDCMWSLQVFFSRAVINELNQSFDDHGQKIEKPRGTRKL